ncbi:MAG: sulfate/molybdate ABC transporter ATP-binding protein [Hyphomicrobium sp.]
MSIAIKGISKSFGTFRALDNISLDLPRGELVALLGPSGCGKTTLLRIIAGLERADIGQILLDGADATDAHVRERRVGFVFQHYALFRHMTVFENVAFGLRVKPRAVRPNEAAIRDRVMLLLDLVQLSWQKDRFPSQLSGGQRQRIALARALAVEPKVLLLDEPFGALDAKVRKELRRWLRRLHDELHISSVFVTHDQEEALEVSDRIVLMNRGKIEQIGSPREIYHSPATSFAYSFIGNVNAFQGHVEGPFVRVGSDLLAHGGASLAEGQPVVAYARPHDTEIIVGDDDPRAGVAARINRVLASGAVTRVELIANGPDRGDRKDYFEVEMTPEAVEQLGVREGQRVRLASRRLSVFPNS